MPHTPTQLATRITARRTALGLGQTDAAKAAGVSRPTWAGWEKGVMPYDRNWSAIERVLRWAKGSINSVLNGGEPTLLSESPDTSSGPEKKPQPATEQRDSTLPVAVRQAIESRATYATEQIEFPELNLIVIAKVGEYEDIETLRRQAAEWATIQRAIRDAQRRPNEPSEQQPPQQDQ